MTKHWYKNPQRHPKNIDGPFYSLTEDDPTDNNCHSSCLDCDIPQREATDLIKSLYDKDGDTYFIKQPETAKELSAAIASSEVCCVNAIRYAGNDPEIIKQMNPDLCDYQINKLGHISLKKEYKNHQK